MVIDHPRDGPTVFSLFADRARQRSPGSLLEQAIASTLVGVLLLLASPSWWPLAAGLGASAGYAAWGLIDRRPRSRITGATLLMLAAVTAVFAFMTAVGLGLAAFTGDGRSPKGTCYDANGRAFACNARGERRQ
jgi:hypothetical protein